ncbi:hypothetical protein [Abyssalbus ytuae]|uniref:Uncharacterized protein n=1 Tax=Abyssalbus ytuae TaxID=2926907 RepID=A0A9E6ZSS7_9FLAO|nr:hypothetical protein [Abyssalbus ytuae]UOB17188.1 hypothetical protein MQE35_15780 [Abyssalbus ytuae]
MIALVTPTSWLQNYVEDYLVIEGTSQQIFGAKEYTVNFSETAGFFFNYGDNCYRIDKDDKKHNLPKSGVYGLYDQEVSYYFEEKVKLIFVILRSQSPLNISLITKENLKNSYTALTDIFGIEYRRIEYQIYRCETLKSRINLIENFLFEILHSKSLLRENDENYFKELDNDLPLFYLN